MADVIKVGLLGKGLAKSQSKNLHELLGELYDVPIVYQLLDMADRSDSISVHSELKKCMIEGYRGLNVTHPYKREAFAEVTPVTGLSSVLTSVNTVLFEKDRIWGDNTDFSGFIQAFQNRFGRDYLPGRVLLIGAGGVGVAIAAALCRLKVQELIVYDTCIESAKTLVQLLSESGGVARVANPNLADEMKQARGLVNATPLGMYQYPGNPFPVSGMGGQEWAFDAVYTPEKTEFLAECQQRSISVLSGFRLFLYQGLDAFRIFTGITPDATLVEPEFLKRFPQKSH